jgi:hypothetical protein
MKSALFALCALSTLSWAGGSKKPSVPPPSTPQPLVQTPIEEVVQSGTQSQVATSVWLSPGLYELSELKNSSRSSVYWLVDTYANDPSQLIVIHFDKNAMGSNRSSPAYIYHARLIKNRSSLMLSPLFIDKAGNLRILSESTRDVPVLELSANPDNSRHPYLVRGRNGALGGAHFKLRASGRSQPVLQSRPDNGRFLSGDRHSSDAVFVNGELSISNRGRKDSTYTLIPLNGSGGKFMGLVDSHLDTMAEEEISFEQIQGLSVFVTRCFDQDVLLHFEPTNEAGRFNLNFFRQAARNIVESFVWPQ